MSFVSSGAMAYGVNIFYPVSASKREEKSWTEHMQQLFEDSEINGSRQTGKGGQDLELYNTGDGELLFLFSFATTWFGLKCSPQTQKYTLGMETKTEESFWS